MYGVSKTALSTILISGRCDLDVIHQEHDTLFGGRLPAPTADTLRALQNQVMEWNYDLGIATDGDADRLGVIDDKGHFLHPNDILVLLYYYLIRYKGLRGPVVRNLATTHRLDQVAAAFGEKCYEVPVGFKYISAKMTETGAVIGGESSGGLTVARAHQRQGRSLRRHPAGGDDCGHGQTFERAGPGDPEGVRGNVHGGAGLRVHGAGEGTAFGSAL